MRKVRLNKVSINNFKLFTNFEYDFQKSDLIVLDGPNGFGKSSFFDAIELLLTTSINRYKRYSDDSIDKSLKNKYRDNLYYNDKKNDDLSIKGVFIIDNKELILECKLFKSDIDSVTRHLPNNFELFKFYINDNELSKIKYKDTIGEKLGANFIRSFSHFHYIEQEDSIVFLKQDEKSRKQAINYLFNTQNINNKISSLENIQKTIKPVFNSQAREALKTKDEKLKNLKTETEKLKKTEGVKYKKILQELKVDEFWDREDIKFKDDSFQRYINEVNDLKNFLLNFKDFKKSIKNKRINGYANNEKILENLIIVKYFISEIESIKIKYNKQEKIKKWKEQLSTNLKETIIKRNIDFSKIFKTFDLSVNEENLNIKISEIIAQSKSENDLDAIVSKISESRSFLIQRFEQHRKNHFLEAECPLCGYDWGNIEELSSVFEKKEEKFKSYLTETGKTIKKKISDFKEEYIDNILKKIDTYFKDENNLIDKDFYKQLQGANDDIKIKEVIKKVDEYNININHLINKEKKKIEDIKNLIMKLSDFLKDNLFKYEKENIKDNYKEIYNNYFDESEDKIALLNINDIDNKLKYIRYQYYLSNNKIIEKKQKEYDKQSKKIKETEKISNKIKSVIGIYKDERDMYVKKIVKDIEILFHIYSGRIVQSQQRGLGLFIEQKQGLKFQSNINSDHDALLSMSAGQLSSLIIAFSLTLNKIYSKNTLFFIDDPIQTMDELNIASLVELLRNEFTNRQFILATHEDHISMYFRYKFRKYKLKTLSVEMKKINNIG